jgi:hypothetical protein
MIGAMVVVVAALALGGCGSPSPVAQPAPSAPSAARTIGATRPCDILTPAAAATALGASRTLTPTKDTADTCAYEATTGLDTIEITVDREIYSATVVAALRDSTGAVAVPGLGDAALRHSVGDHARIMSVWAKDRYLSITLTIVSRTANLDEIVVAAARASVARL